MATRAVKTTRPRSRHCVSRVPCGLNQRRSRLCAGSLFTGLTPARARPSYRDFARQAIGCHRKRTIPFVAHRGLQVERLVFGLVTEKKSPCGHDPCDRSAKFCYSSTRQCGLGRPGRMAYTTSYMTLGLSKSIARLRRACKAEPARGPAGLGALQNGVPPGGNLFLNEPKAVTYFIYYD